MDSLLLTSSRSDVVTPAEWQSGKDLLLKPGQDTSCCSKKYDLPSGKNYMNFVKQEGGQGGSSKQ